MACMCVTEKRITSPPLPKTREKVGKRDGGTNKSNASGEDRGNHLVVSQRFKEVLCASFMLNNDNADKICADILIQEKD